MRTIKLLLVVLLFSLSAWAQANELGVLVGGHVPIGSSLDTGPGLAIQGVYSRRIAAVPLLALYGELPVTANLNLQARAPFATVDFSTLFITPGFKLKLAPGLPVSPYVVAGVGWGRFRASSGTTERTDNKTVWDFGGGLDMKVLPFISLRGEVRDYRSGTPRLLDLGGPTGHNLIGAGGIVLRL
ncbi:MAG: outer membrane protein [Terriglobales bacterium]